MYPGTAGILESFFEICVSWVRVRFVHSEWAFLLNRVSACVVTDRFGRDPVGEEEARTLFDEIDIYGVTCPHRRLPKHLHNRKESISCKKKQGAIKRRILL